jgi:hypothetical protein
MVTLVGRHSCCFRRHDNARGFVVAVLFWLFERRNGDGSGTEQEATFENKRDSFSVASVLVLVRPRSGRLLAAQRPSSGRVSGRLGDAQRLRYRMSCLAVITRSVMCLAVARSAFARVAGSLETRSGCDIA